MTDEETTEYTKFETKIQLGDGVDRRGDVRVEMVRERPRGGSAGVTQRAVTVPGGEEVTITTDDKAFAEFYFEAGRAAGVLREKLGLEETP